MRCFVTRVMTMGQSNERQGTWPSYSKHWCDWTGHDGILIWRVILAHHGNTVALFNRHYSRTEKLMNEHVAPKATSLPAETSRNSPRP